MNNKATGPKIRLRPFFKGEYSVVREENIYSSNKREGPPGTAVDFRFKLGTIVSVPCVRTLGDVQQAEATLSTSHLRPSEPNMPLLL